MLRTISAYESGSEPAPSPPAVNGVLSMSAQVLTGDVCQVAQKLISLAPLPSQVNLVASNCTLAVPINGSMGRPRPNVPNTVPSLAETLYRWFAALRLPAP